MWLLTVVLSELTNFKQSSRSQQIEIKTKSELMPIRYQQLRKDHKVKKLGIINLDGLNFGLKL
jgi:hypothetical protein